jgi:outer membrane protein TolC
MPQALRMPGIVFLSLLMSTLVSGSLHGQHVSGAHHKNDSVPLFRPANAPISAAATTPAPPDDAQIEAKLVELALQGPRYESAGHTIKQSQYQLSKAKKSWLNLLAVSYNYNVLSSPVNASTSAYIYPRYFFGLTIPLGVIFTLGPEIKGAREAVAVSVNAREELARTIKADVLSKYKQYKNFGELILLQNTIVVDAQAAFSQVEKKFKDGTVAIELYNTANKNYSDELAKKLNLQLSQDLVRLSIEQLIGVSLESVIK